MHSVSKALHGEEEHKDAVVNVQLKAGALQATCTNTCTGSRGGLLSDAPCVS